MNDAPVPTLLKASIERLYDVFSRHPQPTHSHWSSHAGITEADAGKLYSKPLRQLTPEDLWQYAWHAMNTWGDTKEFKHYLPRLFELLALHPGWTDAALLIGHLTTAEWKQWREVEQDSVNAFLHELWVWSLVIDPYTFRCDSVLQGFGLAGADPAKAIAAWEADLSRQATLQLAALVCVEREALLTTRTLSRLWLSPLKEILLEFLLATNTRARLEAAYLNNVSDVGAKEISDAVDILARL